MTEFNSRDIRLQYPYHEGIEVSFSCVAIKTKLVDYGKRDEFKIVIKVFRNEQQLTDMTISRREDAYLRMVEHGPRTRLFIIGKESGLIHATDILQGWNWSGKLHRIQTKSKLWVKEGSDIDYIEYSLIPAVVDPIAVIKGGQELAWIDRDDGSLNSMKLCSYSEYYDWEIDKCQPCEEQSFSSIDDTYSCKLCLHDFVISHRDGDQLVFCKDPRYHKDWPTQFNLVDIDPFLNLNSSSDGQSNLLDDSQDLFEKLHEINSTLVIVSLIVCFLCCFFVCFCIFRGCCNKRKQ